MLNPGIYSTYPGIWKFDTRAYPIVYLGIWRVHTLGYPTNPGIGRCNTGVSVYTRVIRACTTHARHTRVSGDRHTQHTRAFEGAIPEHTQCSRVFGDAIPGHTRHIRVFQNRRARHSNRTRPKSPGTPPATLQDSTSVSGRLSSYLPNEPSSLGAAIVCVVGRC